MLGAKGTSGGQTF